MNEREKQYYKGEINRLKNLQGKCRLDDYDGRANYQVQIDDLENKVKGLPGYEGQSTEELKEERKKLEKSAFGTVAILFPGKAAYSYAKIKRIDQVLNERRLEEKKEKEFVSDIFDKSDFVEEEETPANDPAKEEGIDKKLLAELTEYTAQVLRELYRYGMDFDLVKKAYGERVVPVILSGVPEQETYQTFEYYSSGNYVYRVFKGGMKYSGDEYDSIRSEDDYHKLISDTKYQYHLCGIKMPLEELAEKFINRSITDPRYIAGKTRTFSFRRKLTEVYDRRGGANAVDEMKELIKNYLLVNIKLSETYYG